MLSFLPEKCFLLFCFEIQWPCISYVFPGLVKWFQDCSCSRRGSSTPILIWGLRSKLGMLVSLNSLILMRYFQRVSWQHPGCSQQQGLWMFIQGTPSWSLFCHSLLLLLFLQIFPMPFPCLFLFSFPPASL